MNINWYPGHMKKTKELIKNNLKLVDVVIELYDARIPISSKNPEIDKIISNKPKIVVLNKYDLSDPKILKKWLDYYSKLGINAIPFNALSGEGMNNLLNAIKNAAKDKIEILKKKGRKLRPIRVMIVGIPNVGKSSLINKLVGKKSAKTGNKPGVTRGKQWIRIRKDIELFDTPGILWPKFDDEKVGLNLAFTGSIRDEILDIDELCLELIKTLLEKYPNNLKERYNLDNLNKEALEIMEDIGRNRGCISAGGIIDYTRIANIVLDDFRKGKLGKITLETPEDINNSAE
ncbi:ribosome biogenesis GTPase A [Caminicella sporogenes DSM 14501]|uniref:Ribosome biogenesis GTPase A n=1 Tax=Caminicella sporogenes DSM 14501 TaxID=1121266 RepID=A0A1M6LDW4_9FIRM|nr:ribosome biogenesis GTPase YlqF [Caminicella sporogenes]RKD27803.1 ribosome biogenesis GTPase YlqF [Caminicella sporogenes]SHJ69409.1 ribosome biogenesis GTPase A [Caminicella sporogenes DSM 14501]